MKITNTGGSLVIHVTDREAEELVQNLSAVLHNRKRIIAVEPSLRNWADGVAVMPGTVDCKTSNICISICGI